MSAPLTRIRLSNVRAHDLLTMLTDYVGRRDDDDFLFIVVVLATIVVCII